MKKLDWLKKTANVCLKTVNIREIVKFMKRKTNVLKIYQEIKTLMYFKFILNPC